MDKRERQGARPRRLTPFGAWLTARIRELGLTQREFAEKAGISDSNVSNWMTGHARGPNNASAKRLSDALGTPIEELRSIAKLSEDVVAPVRHHLMRGVWRAGVHRLRDAMEMIESTVSAANQSGLTDEERERVREAQSRIESEVLLLKRLLS